MTTSELEQTSLRKVVGLGAGGHAAVIIEVLQAAGGFEVVEVTDSNPAMWSREILSIPVRGGDERLPALLSGGVRAAFVGVGATKSVGPRRRIFEHAVSLGFDLITVVHPRAYVAPSARLGAGTMVLPGAVINACVRLGQNVTVYSGVIIEHGTQVGDHTHLSPGVHIAGGVQIGAECFIGIGASIIQNVRIGDGVVVGAGAVVLRHLPSGCTAVGIPARPIERRAVPDGDIGKGNSG